jgi:hypothetical protein
MSSKYPCKSCSSSEKRKDKSSKCECNDTRSKRDCNAPYRYKCGKKVYLNLSPPACVLADPVQSKLYKKTYKNIVEYKLENKINALIELTPGSPEQEVAYNQLLNLLVEIFNAPLGSVSPRVLVTEPDGKVIYDTSRGVEGNTVQNFNAGLVNENHNTRPAIMAAQLFECGVGHEIRFSNSVDANQSYVAVRAGKYLDRAYVIRYSRNI